jgi:zinc transporter ZupT
LGSLNPNQRPISYKKVVKLLILLLLAGISAYYLQPWYAQSDRASIIIVSVFSMLSGFLLAVMAVVANDKSLRGRNWREKTYYLQSISDELLRHQITFYVYLLTLVAVFAASVSDTWCSDTQKIAQYALLFFATIGIALSFRLPAELKKRHESMLKNHIENEKEKERQAALKRSEDN